MIPETVVKKLNQQLNLELSSEYAYLALAIDCESKAFTGAGKWFRLQAAEERLHAEKIIKYLLDQGRTPTLEGLPQPAQGAKTLTEAFHTALKNEQRLSETLIDLSRAASSAGDATTAVFLEWFLTEQVEEVSSCQTIVDQLKLVGDSGPGLFMLDRELGARQPEPDA